MMSNKLKMHIFQDRRRKIMEARENNENKLIKEGKFFSDT